MSVKLEKLDIRVCPYTQNGTVRNAAIHYKIRQQDGTFQDMTCRDTPSMRHFVEYVQIHD
jgi:hypothetical protein